MNLSAPFVRRPIGTALLTIGLMLAGIAAFFNLPVSPLPQVDFPTIGVSANLAGASPETMATSVATPLERRLGRIADVSEMTSRSSVGSTNITLQFGLDRDINGAARDVMAAINAARADLPATLRQNPTYQKRNPADSPILVLAMTSKTKTPGQIYDSAATIVQQQLSQVRGVGEVEIGGASLPAVRVELNPLSLAKYGVGMEDVRAALSSANANRPKGLVQDADRRFQIYTNDAGTKAADYAPLIVAYRNGAAVRLADVADVQDSVEDVHNLGLFNGQPAVVVIVRRQPGANIIATVDSVKARLPTLAESLPADIDTQVASDRTTSIRSSLHEVEMTLILSIVLVVAVTLFFLRSPRSTIIPAIAVIASLMGTVGLMLLLGFSLNNLSLMALTVATGFVVDDAIVVLENVTRHVEEGVPRYQAALLGAREVGFTVLSISISLVAVFIPILLMGGIVGRLFREFAMTLSAAIMVSLLISLTTTPMMCAYLIKVPKREQDGRGTKKRENWAARIARRSVDGMANLYEKALRWAMDAAPVMLAILVCTIALNVYLFTIVPKGFFPQQDTGQLMGGFRMDQSSSFQIARERLIRFVKVIKSDPAVDTVVAFQGGRGGSAGAFLMVSLKPKNQRDVGGQAVIQRLRPKLARISGASLFLNPVQDVRVGGRQSNATYQYTLEADDLNALKEWAGKLTEAIKRQPVLTDVNSDQEDHGLESFVTVDRDKAASFNLSARDVDNALYDAFGQRQVSTIYKDLNQYHVIMEVDPKFGQDPTTLRDVYVARSASSSSSSSTASTATTSTTAVAASSTAVGNTLASGSTTAGGVGGATGATGATGSTSFQPTAPPSRDASAGTALSTRSSLMVPLASIATWADGSTPTSVNHQDLSVATTISFNLADGASLSDATAAIQQAQAEIGMPANVHGSFRGTAQVFQESLKNEPILVAFALLAVYIVLGILYESYVHPLTVLSTLPSAGVGAVLALIIFHVEFSIIAMIGVVLLIGIVKKNAIMIIDFALEAERSQGLSTRDAVYQACLLRFRPIMMTTFAAMLGALPLAIGWGEGSELRRPLGITIIGGLLFSQVITLLTTPIVYLYLDRLRGRKRDEHHLGRHGSPGEPERQPPRGGPQPAPQGV